jgi:hypothetical protein
MVCIRTPDKTRTCNHLAMDESARVTHAKGVRARLDQMWGAENAAARIAMAQQLDQKAEKSKSGLIAMLGKSGAGSELTTIAQLGLHAERMFLHKGITIGEIVAKLKK